jgi:hypothetical protein
VFDAGHPRRGVVQAKLKITWWVWAAIAVPWMLLLLFKQHEDKAGDVWSDWSWFVAHARQAQWSYCREVLVWDVLVPLVLGWVAQYLIVLAWQRWRNGRRSLRAAHE